jgi:uncharacterized protein YcfL
MLAKFFYIILLSLLLGCSSNEEIDLSQYVSINDRVLNLNFVNENVNNIHGSTLVNNLSKLSTASSLHVVCVPCTEDQSLLNFSYK